MSSDCNERPDGFKDTVCPVDNNLCEGQGTDAQCGMCLASKTRPLSDVELQALSTLVVADVTEIEAGNNDRAHHGYAPAYGLGAMWGMDSYRCLEAELRRRGVIKTPGAAK